MENKDVIAKIASLIEEASLLAREELELTNIFYNESYIDLLIANILNHDYMGDTQGPDATEYGEWHEYKTINLNNKSGGGSFQFHWLSKNKIEKYSRTKYIFFATRKNAVIEEIYKLKTDKIILDLISKAEEKGTYCEGAPKIGAHKSYALSTILRKGAVLVYRRERN
tara:strand:- start:809 stop:1312 length:504 start_codon:yes stop_codon:yes gene_type:complete